MLDLLNSATSRYQPRYQHETSLRHWEGNLRDGYFTAAANTASLFEELRRVE
jgi:hypothetical protein